MRFPQVLADATHRGDAFHAEAFSSRFRVHRLSRFDSRALMN